MAEAIELDRDELLYGGDDEPVLSALALAVAVQRLASARLDLDLNKKRVANFKEEAQAIADIGLEWKKKFTCIIEQFCSAAVKQDDWKEKMHTLADRLMARERDLADVQDAVERARSRVKAAAAAAEASARALTAARALCLWE